MRLGHCIRRLKQLWPAGCVVASLLHANPQYGGCAGGVADQPTGEAALAAAASALESTDDGPDVPGIQRRWVWVAWLVRETTSGELGLVWWGGRPGAAAACMLRPWHSLPSSLVATIPTHPARLDFCEALLNAATGYGIAGCWQWKPLLDGKQVG